jgi:GNAT superfamily N-acetyltransferase
MRAALEDDPDDKTLTAMIAGLRAFNADAVSGVASHRITAAIRDEAGALHGGVIGRMAGDSVYIEVVWTDDAARGQGLGAEAMRLVEDEARKLGAREAWLYTMSFQAKPFYEKLGYTQFAQLAWLEGRHARHFMRKDL